MITMLTLCFFSYDFYFVFILLLFGFLVLMYSGSGLTYREVFCIDYFSFIMLLLSLLVFFCSVLSVFYDKLSFYFWSYINTLLPLLFFSLFFLFSCIDLFFFYVFFEITIIPTFVIIIGWGYRINRLQASLYIVFYMLLSSYPFLFSFISFFILGVSYRMLISFYGVIFSSIGFIWWLLFFVVFFVRLPVFLIHLWLPKAHVDAPLLGSMILAGVLLKIGGFGLLKVRLIFFHVFICFSFFFGCFSLIGSIYCSIICLRQFDLKSLVAYSSIVHIGPVIACFFFLSYYRVLGSFLLIFSHGLCSCGLFFLLNIFSRIYYRRRLFCLRGSILYLPILSYLWACLSLSNMGCPPTFNFFSELFTIFSCILYRNFIFFIFFFIILLVGFYCISLLVSVFHGRASSIFIGGDFLKVVDLLSSLLLLAFIFFFILFSYIFLCQFSFKNNSLWYFSVFDKVYFIFLLYFCIALFFAFLFCFYFIQWVFIRDYIRRLFQFLFSIALTIRPSIYSIYCFYFINLFYCYFL